MMATASSDSGSGGPAVAQAELSPAACISLIALVLLGSRFVQGFIFWGGASRRLFYDDHPVAGVGARATIALPAPAEARLTGDGPLTLVLEAIDSATWQGEAQPAAG